MPQQFFIRVQHGITGGFAPPNPDQVHTLTSSVANGSTSILLQKTVKAKGQKKLPDEPTSQSTVPTDKHDDVDKLVKELESILKDLPREDPPGSKDIYGLDIGIMYGSDNLEWANGGPAGCGEGNSMVEATDEQKEQFKKALGIIEKLGELGQVSQAST